MIPVQPQPEPEDFAERVKKPGVVFLRQVPHPTTGQWKGKEYWRRALHDMRTSYNGVCAYSALWISPDASVDHFVPRVRRPDLAYEWSNFRYTALKFNARKGTHTILDPFRLELDWFILDFDSFLIRPNSHLTSEQKALVQNTIDILKLNDDEDCVELRQDWVRYFRSGEITFDFLQRKAPFIAHELHRQGLVEEP